MKLYLDDVRDLPDESFDLARSYDEAVLFVKENGIPTFISLEWPRKYRHKLIQLIKITI